MRQSIKGGQVPVTVEDQRVRLPADEVADALDEAVNGDVSNDLLRSTEVDGEVLGWLREATEAEVAAAVECEVRAYGSARDAACLPFGMVGELRRKLGPIALAVLLLFMGVGIMNFRVSAEFPCLRQRAAFSSASSAHHRMPADRMW